MKKPLITITVAIYNAEKYLIKCIESVKNQSYENWDLLLVNDGSKDNSKSICERYARGDGRIRLINKENGGLSSARQAGLDAAYGKYVCFIDPDDYLDKDYLKLLQQKISDTHADICLCSSVYVSENSSNIVRISSDLDDVVKVDLDILKDNYFLMCGTYYMSDSWNKLYKTQFIRETGVGFELACGLNGSDLAFNHKLLLHCPVLTYVKEALYYHEIVDNSAVHRKNRKLINSYMIIMRQLLNEAEQMGITSSVNNELSKTFIRFLRDGLHDSFIDIRKASERYSCIKTVDKEMRAILESYPMLNMHVRMNESKTLELFRVSLNRKVLTYIYMTLYTKFKQFL